MGTRKTKVVIIINPISGVGKQGVIETLAPQVINASLVEYEIVYTQYAGHLTELCKHYATLNYDVVCAVGGDGTMHEAANGLIHSLTALCIIPTGSGNGLARHLHISLRLKKALQQLNSTKRISIDCVQFNHTHFVNVAGIGFDAHVAHAFANAGSRGLKTYIKMCMRSIRAFKPITVALTTNDNKTVQGTYFIVAIGNASQYGNNATICPIAELRNGTMCVTLVKPMSWWQLPMFLTRLFTSKLKQNKYIQFIEANAITLTQSASIAHLDGEAITNATTIHCKIVPNALSVVVV
ncbi:MAG: diacylglycerol kinase family protein [Bacteroidia bacterium]